MDALNLFKNMSGLVPSMAKSTVFFGNVTDLVKQRILAIMPFEEGSLPVRYLGVPLISTRLQYKDCKQLVERMDARISDWKTKCLSFAGRLQLIRSVLSSLHIYWASVFILPKRIIKDLEDKMKRFLWAQGGNIKGKAKVKWKSVCVPRCEGGLGIRRVGDMNSVLMSLHVWSVLTHRESLWVKWIHSYRFQNRLFWEIPVKGNITWSWRKMLSLRPMLRNYIWIEIGDGSNTLVWFDKWDAVCPIGNIVTPRMIANAGFNMETKLAEVHSHGEWRWPTQWVVRFPALATLRHIILNANHRDKLVWKTREGIQVEFSSASVWDDVRTAQNEVQWEKVRTLMNICFFECGYASEVWNEVKVKADMGAITNQWHAIFDYLVGIANSKKASHAIAKLVVSAAAYFVWDERNRRLFTTKRRNKT
ncbi:uncharacterized protein LOC110944014 [Helianthus annuus]|uniref:uncharacterized protein LOC110944014 n=1 Tax=Helianthus annuus TaxID=4232 RepID=UPI000B907486|nr:uncharacterized protein LOC110944014 [Helianthus annuus]